MLGGWRRGTVSFALRTVALLAVAACAPDGARATEGVTSLVLIDSVAIVETDSVFVGRPNAIAVDATGRLYIPDGAAKRVLRVDRDGSGLVPMTREGSGPGEVR